MINAAGPVRNAGAYGGAPSKIAKTKPGATLEASFNGVEALPGGSFIFLQ